MKSYCFSFLIGAAFAVSTTGVKGEVAAPGGPEKAAPAKEQVPGTPFMIDALEEAKAPETPEERVALFFERLKKQEVNVAYKELLRGSKIAEVTKDVNLLEVKTVEAIRFAGPITGADFVERRVVGTGGNLIGLTYISLGKGFPLRWRFYFYKAEERWRLIDIRISDRLQEMFKEGGTPFDDKE